MRLWLYHRVYRWLQHVADHTNTMRLWFYHRVYRWLQHVADHTNTMRLWFYHRVYRWLQHSGRNPDVFIELQNYFTRGFRVPNFSKKRK